MSLQPQWKAKKLPEPYLTGLCPNNGIGGSAETFMAVFPRMRMLFWPEVCSFLKCQFRPARMT